MEINFSRNLTILSCILLFSACVVSGYNFEDVPYDDMRKGAYEMSGSFATVKDAYDYLSVKPVEYTKGGKSKKCSPFLLRVTNTQTLSEDTHRPQVLLSGEIHGNERVGPQAVYVTAQLLTLSAESLVDNFSLDYKNAIQNKQIIWLAMLATKRDTFHIPTANCYGYDVNIRTDVSNVDTNRDFGYSRSDEGCLKSGTAKMFNSLMLKSMIQSVITYHGGMQAIGYEWGSPNHHGNDGKNDRSPDDRANRLIAGSMQVIGGHDSKRRGFENSYVAGPINTVIYPVDGGMEDWMYAAGWDNERPNLSRKCTANSDTDIPNNHALVFLIETSDMKQPHNADLGGSTGILNHKLSSSPNGGAGGNGHVPRNVRTSLVAIDTVQPYVCITQVTSAAGDDTSTLSIEWSVGGGSNVDNTWLQWHPVGATEEEMYPRAGDDTYLFSKLTTPQTLPPQAKRRSLADPLLDPYHAKFSDEVNMPSSHLHGTSKSSDDHQELFWLVAWAEVDSSWGATSQGDPQNVGPQSHLVNARTDDKYFQSNTQSTLDSVEPRVIQGRKYWPSEPILVSVSKAQNRMEVLAFTKYCAFWDRKTIQSGSSNSVILGADGHGLPPDDLSGSSDGNDAATRTAGGIGEDMKGLSGHEGSHNDLSNSRKGGSYMRLYTLAMIIAASFACFLLAQRVFGRSPNSSGDNAVSMVAAGQSRSWNRSQNFV
eukprot:GSChrysophyteH1.ASY1.ANO1.2067.1 assembled CDS